MYLKPRVFPLKEMLSRSWNEIEAGLDAAVVVLFEGGSNAKVLGTSSRLFRYPLQHPEVALVATGYFQCGEKVAAGKKRKLRSRLTEECECCSNANKTSTSREYRII